jgi:hypothetical protein
VKILTPKKQQKVVAAYPHPSSVSARFHKSWDALRQYDFGNLQRIANGGGHLPNSSGANVTNARNEIVAKFLDEHDADWLWFIDTDMVFDPDILDRLVEAAHPVERPILGALCFSIQDGFRACPTLYVIREDGKAGRVYDYPANTRMRVFTGTGCLLIHRTALGKMRDRAFDPAYPWFQETRTQDLPIGEDITFCIRAEAIGIPVHVDTSIRCGHEKTYVVDEDVYLAQRQAGLGEVPTPLEPTYAVIASKNRRAMVTRLVDQLRPQCADVFVFDNGYDPPLDSATLAHGWPLHRMWNEGIAKACEAADGPYNVLVINDDCEVASDAVNRLAVALRSGDFDMAIPSQGQMTGWCFMLRGESNLRLDEQFEWWYGDTDLAHRCSGRIVCSDAEVRHLDPMRSTLSDPERLEQARRDEARYAAKHGIDPSTLWLARNAHRLAS